MCRILSSKFIKLILGIFFLFLTPKLVIASEYIPRGYFVIDLKNKIEWMTCPVGMVWNKNTCSGVAKKYELNYLDTEVGDLTSDHLINVYDLVAVIELIIEGQYHEKADQNGDGEVNNVDIDILTELIMNL